MSKKAKKEVSFLDSIPQKKVFQDVWMNENKLPPQHGRQLEAAEEGGTLMGRLSARMASRDMIDELDLGPKGRSPEAKKAQIADSAIPGKISIEGPAIRLGTKMEKEHTKSDKKAKKIAKDHLKEFPRYYDKNVGLPAMEKKLKETADNEIPSKMMIGAGLHQQTADLKASNMQDTLPTTKSRKGNNMAEQAKNAGNVWNTMDNQETEQQKSLKKSTKY